MNLLVLKPSSGLSHEVGMARSAQSQSWIKDRSREGWEIALYCNQRQLKMIKKPDIQMFEWGESHWKQKLSFQQFKVKFIQCGKEVQQLMRQRLITIPLSHYRNLNIRLVLEKNWQTNKSQSSCQFWTRAKNEDIWYLKVHHSNKMTRKQMSCWMLTTRLNLCLMWIKALKLFRN